jgi:hypothetical protein
VSKIHDRTALSSPGMGSGGKGYFRAEGLDYELKEFIRATDGGHHATAGKSGAFQSIEKRRESNVTCACHWTVNVEASRGHTKLFADAYSVAPSGIFVRNDTAIKSPEDLAGVPISVGFQSGSHYATIQALEPYLARDRINLSFGEGMLFHRMEASSTARRRRRRYSAAPITLQSNSVTASSSIPRS